MDASAIWQLIAAIGTVAGVWFASRHDARQARTELQKSVENAINPKLEILANSVAAVGAWLGRVEGRLGQVEVDVGALKADVAFIRGRQEERDKTAAPSAS